MTDLQAKAANVTVEEVASVLATPGNATAPVGNHQVWQAANAVYGATAASLNSAGMPETPRNAMSASWCVQF